MICDQIGIGVEKELQRRGISPGDLRPSDFLPSSYSSCFRSRRGKPYIFTAPTRLASPFFSFLQTSIRTPHQLSLSPLSCIILGPFTGNTTHPTSRTLAFECIEVSSTQQQISILTNESLVSLSLTYQQRGKVLTTSTSSSNDSGMATESRRGQYYMSTTSPYDTKVLTGDHLGQSPNQVTTSEHGSRQSGLTHLLLTDF